MEEVTYYKCKVDSLLRFKYFDMIICGSAQLLSCSHLVTHTSILLIFKVNLIGQGSFLGAKTWHFLVHPIFQCL